MRNRSLLQLLPLLLLPLLIDSCSPENLTERVEKNVNITNDVEWRGTHIIEGQVTVNNAVLTIAEGANIEFRDGAVLMVGTSSSKGAIAICGTQDNPVVFESEAPLYRHKGVQILTNDPRNRLEYLTISGSGYNDLPALKIRYLNFPIRGLITHNIEADAVDIMSYMPGSQVRIENCQISARKYALNAPANILFALDRSNSIESSGIHLRGELVKGNITIPKFKSDYVLKGTLVLEGAISIERNVRFLCETNAAISVGDNSKTSITARGVTFTKLSEEVDPGQWKGIRINRNTLGGSASIFEDCEVAYAGGGDMQGGMEIRNVNSFQVSQCLFKRNAGYGLVIIRSSIEPNPTNNQFDNNIDGNILRVP